MISAKWEMIHEFCILCGEETDRMLLPSCKECSTILKTKAPGSLTENLKFLISQYRLKYKLISDVKSELLSGGVAIADKAVRVTERVKGERKVRHLTAAYRFHKLIEDIVDQAPEEHLRLRVRYKGKKAVR